ncbi:hypothetical protein [Enterococcus sp. BWR-S5]|uniref:hypothetical protein n=1 Tax=Enterococcus sp. BWR-S5 TaxID=2787714 RepID=UPI0019205272|nr:hypothetical protein [Enterococcus sp. BWR-S5]MBL1225207.1 hypothetical protein [Enterococcus sp. BWR-S5]
MTEKENHFSATKNHTLEDILYKLKAVYQPLFQDDKLDLEELKNLLDGFIAPSDQKFYQFNW